MNSVIIILTKTPLEEIIPSNGVCDFLFYRKERISAMLQATDKKEKTGKKVKLKVNKKKMIRALGILVIFIYIIHTTWVHFRVTQYDKLIYPGIKVEGVKLGGKTKGEAITLLKKNYEKELLRKNILIKVQDKVYTISYSKLNINYNIEDTVEDAFKYGKDKGFYDKYKAIKKAEEKQFRLKYNYDRKEIEEVIKKIEEQFNKDAVDASIIKSIDDKFKISPEKIGQALDKEQLIKNIDEGISNKAIKDIVVSAEIKKVDPKIKKADLEKIDTKVSTFTTNFSSSSDSRANNINVAAKSLNGILAMPDETFSFNKVVGERTEKRGYKAAAVIVGDKLESGLGGGVCQVSTTLHNAIVRAGISPKERQHHSMPVKYVGLGMDATVDYGSIDYKFKNTLKYPLYIECLIKDKDLIFNIYSNSQLLKRNYDLINSVKTINRKGKIVRVAKGYKITYENGKEISREEINSDEYEQ